MINYRTPYPNELWHHGILGMKWGKRNGPPYPLSPGSHSASEKKAGWEKSLDSNTNRSGQIKKNNKIVSKTQVVSHDEKTVREQAYKNNANVIILDKKPEKTQSFFKDHKKEILIGASAAAIIAIGAVVVSKQLKNKKVAISELNRAEHEEAIDAMRDMWRARVKAEGPYGIYRSRLNWHDAGKEEFGGFASKSERYMAAWLNSDSTRLKPLTELEYKNMDNSPVILRAGESLFRMSKSDHSGLRNDWEYVSFGEDRDRYKAFLPQMWNWKASNPFSFSNKVSKVFEMELSANVEIKAPGKKDTFDIVEAALKRVFPHRSDADIHADCLAHFNQYMLGMSDRYGQISNAISDEAKARGFNAIIDFNDAGRLADKPLLVLDGAKDLLVKGSTSISVKDTKKLLQDISLPEAREGFLIEDFMNTQNLSQYAQIVKELLNA